MNENKKQKAISTNIRGSLPDGWKDTHVIQPKEIDEEIYLNGNETLQKKVIQMLPFINIDDPHTKIKGRHVVEVTDA